MRHRVANKIERAGDETRTHDSHLGKVVLYQLSYTRNAGHASPRSSIGNAGVR